MAQQGIVTINGYVGGKPRRLGQEGSTPISVFNMGTTRSFFSQASGQWVDLPTLWVKVKAFRSLALNVLDSVHKGEPVIVTGQIGMEEWTDRDGRQQTTIVINATNIGHDLNTGRSVFTKMPRNNQNGQGDQQNGQNVPGDPQQNGEGRDPFNESQGYGANQGYVGNQGYGGNQGFGNQGDQGYGGNQQWNNQQGSNQQASGGPGYGNQGYANQRGYGVGDGGGASGAMNGASGPSGQSAPGAFDRGGADAGPSAWSQRNQQSSQQSPFRAQEQSSQTGIQSTQTPSLQSSAAAGAQPGEPAQSGESSQPTAVQQSALSQQSAPAPAVQTDSFGTETENGNEEF